MIRDAGRTTFEIESERYGKMELNPMFDNIEFKIRSISSLTDSGIEITESTFVGQRTSQLDGYKLRNKTLTLTIDYDLPVNTTSWSWRSAINTYFALGNKLIVYYNGLADDDLQSYIIGYVSDLEMQRFSKYNRVVITMVCTMSGFTFGWIDEPVETRVAIGGKSFTMGYPSFHVGGWFKCNLRIAMDESHLIAGDNILKFTCVDEYGKYVGKTKTVTLSNDWTTPTRTIILDYAPETFRALESLVPILSEYSAEPFRVVTKFVKMETGGSWFSSLKGSISYRGDSY